MGMGSMHTDLSNVSRNSHGYYRKQELESMSYISHIQNRKRMETLQALQKYQVFLHPKECGHVIQSNVSTKHEINKLFSAFFLSNEEENDDVQKKKKGK
jgi:hypothetical protein